MLSISSKCIYGVHALFELAVHYGKESMSIREIASAQRIPEDYLRQLLVQLKKAGLIESKRGLNGGYSLIRTPDSIKIREIIETLEGPFKIGVDKLTERALGQYWLKVKDHITKSFDKTLGDLVKDKQMIENNIIYQI